jgi:hypothetical protein
VRAPKRCRLPRAAISSDAAEDGGGDRPREAATGVALKPAMARAVRRTGRRIVSWRTFDIKTHGLRKAWASAGALDLLPSSLSGRSTPTKELDPLGCYFWFLKRKCRGNRNWDKYG